MNFYAILILKIIFIAMFASYVSTVVAHGALSDDSSEGIGPLIFVPVVIALLLFLMFANRKKGWSVLVIGGAGYAGTSLVSKLLARDFCVTVLDDSDESNNSLKHVIKHLDLKLVKGDFGDPEVLKEALKGCDALIYVAREINYTETAGSNRLGKSRDPNNLKNLVVKADNAGVKKIIFTSCMSVYGNTHSEMINEELEPQPSTKFSQYLVQCENILTELSHIKLDICVVRPGSILGPSEGNRVKGELNEIVRAAILDKSNNVIPGFKSYPFIHIQDLTDLYLFLLDQPGVRINQQIYNAGFGQVEDTELCDTLSSLSKKEINLTFTQSKKAISREFSFTKLTKTLGFEPRFDLRKSLADLISSSDS